MKSTLFKLLKQQDDITLLSVKDYIKEPKPNGYQSLHMIIEIPIFLSSGADKTKVEIQIRTIAMDFWASLEHKLHYKQYDKEPEHISEQLKECANIISDLDNRMLRIKYEIDNYDEDDKAWQEAN